MAIELGPIGKKVRSTLSDVPREFLTDKQILVELEKAQAFCDQIAITGTDEEYLAKCYEVLATYYSYINYTTLAERQLGTLPPTSKIRLDALRRVAVAFLQLVSMYPLDEDLLIDTSELRDTQSACIALMPTVLEDD
jgi:hypothetical protein